jgi:hypothetical protein
MFFHFLIKQVLYQGGTAILFSKSKAKSLQISILHAILDFEARSLSQPLVPIYFHQVAIFCPCQWFPNSTQVRRDFNKVRDIVGL